MTGFKTTELALAALLYRENSKTMKGLDVIKIRGRAVVEFKFELEDTQILEDFKAGKDGILQYEKCRQMMLRMIDMELKKHGEQGVAKQKT